MLCSLPSSQPCLPVSPSQVRVQLDSKLDLLGPTGPRPYAVKIINMRPPENSPRTSLERELTISVCDGDWGQDSTPLLPWDLVLLSDRAVKHSDDFSKDSYLNYAFLIITPPPNKSERSRDESGARVKSSLRYANALVGPETAAMWDRLQERIDGDKPQQFWCVTPMINIATQRRVAR